MTALEYPTLIGDADMRLTPAAQVKIAELLADADAEVTGVRVFVSGEGCSGMTYGMTYAESPMEHYDSIIEAPGMKVYIDPVALNFLQGSEIDFRNDGPSPSFVFNKVFQAVGGSGACGGCGGSGGG